MEYRFDLLFRIQLVHAGLLDISTGFQLVPTADCREELKRFGLIWKEVADGGWVAVERRIPPGTPIRPINRDAAFRFLLILKRPGILNQTEDFAPDPADPFPGFIGQGRLAYFSNLNSSNVIDGSLDLVHSSPAVSKEDLASWSPLRYSFEPAPATTQVTAAPIRPGGGSAINASLSADGQAFLELTPGAWRISQTGSGMPSEVLFADDRLFGNRAFGLVDIYKDETTDYDNPITYTLTFNTV